MRYLKILIISFSLILVQQSFSQGCNDAGICTFGEFGGVVVENKAGIKTEVSYIFGLGEKQNLINTIQLDQRFSFFKDKGGVFFRLPFTYVYGVLAQTAGLGDVTVGVDYSVYGNDRISFSIMAGAKIASDNANKSIKGRGLPMAYQTSLGTYDLLAGAGVNFQTWRIGLAYQKPFGSAGNTFLYDYWEGDEDALKYFESNKLKRGDDVMIRVDKDFIMKSDNRLQAGLLAVYRIQKDQIVKDNETVKLEDSDGFTLNASISYSIHLKNDQALRLLLAAPVITREHRADGLTRTLVFSFTYSFGN